MPKKTENNPGDGDQQEGVAAAQVVVGIMAQIFQHKATASGKNRGDNKGNEIVFLIKESNACTDEQQRAKQEKQRSQYLVYQSEVYHSVSALKYFSSFFRFCSWQNTITESPASIRVLPFTSIP